MKIIKHYTSMLLLGLLLALVSACQNENATTSTPTEETADSLRMEQPAALGMSSDSLNQQVQQKSLEAAEVDKSALIEEAAVALENAEKALSALQDGDKTEALAALEVATGKLEILLARDPELAFVPLNVELQTHDLVADLETIETIKKAARRALQDDQFQLVRDEVAKLASEIEINTSLLPLETFPVAMKAAARLIEEDKVKAAQLVLYNALNTIVIERRRIPLPVLRAEVLIEQAQKEDAKDADRKKEVLQLLDNAAYQLTLAEELGYGRRDKEYAELSEAIEELKKSVEDEGDSKGLFDALSTKLRNFKERISK
ncbi:MAG: hypothetical protein D6772_04565 [Bacteroidetes bacterium]|nr:MAG: hypothetical protein D6772_04565 [Bacteroidota bacterium]